MCNKEKMEDLGCLPNGTHLYRKPNAAGGWIYYSDECGCISMVWDTCIADESTLLAAILSEKHRKYIEYMTEKGWRPPEGMDNEQMAGTGELFLDPIKDGAVNAQEKGESDKDEKWCTHTEVGDVICLDKKECAIIGLGDAFAGEYVVESARDSGGWLLQVRKLDDMGRYCADNTPVQIQQGIGYTCSLPTIRVVRHMSRTFV